MDSDVALFKEMARKNLSRNLREKVVGNKQQVAVLPPMVPQKDLRGEKLISIGHNDLKIPGRKNRRGLKVLTPEELAKVKLIPTQYDGIMLIKRKPSARQVAKYKAIKTQISKTIGTLTSVEEGDFFKQRLGQRLVFLNMVANEKFANPDQYDEEDKQLYMAFNSLTARQKNAVINKVKNNYQEL